MVKAFSRADSRTFVVAQDFAPIVAICGKGEFLKHQFKAETEAGKIVVILSEDKKQRALNNNKIALADEVFILNLSEGYSDFEAEIYNAAEKLGKHIRVLRD